MRKVIDIIIYESLQPKLTLGLQAGQKLVGVMNIFQEWEVH